MATDTTCSRPGCDRSSLDIRLVRGLCPTHYAAWRREGGLGVKCSEPGCEGYAMIKGLCDTHYSRVRRAGGESQCSVVDCGKGVMGRGLCATHYYRWQNDLPLEAPLRKAGRWSDWAHNAKGYVYRRMTLENGRRIVQFQHVHIVEQAIGRPLTEDEEVHHKNGVRDDNRLENLQLWSTRQPKGQHWRDKLEYAREIIALYEPLDKSGFHDGESGDRK